MHRFYCPYINHASKSIILQDIEEIHHLRQVLRLKVGSVIELFNGQGLHACAEIQSISLNSVDCLIRESYQQPVLNPLIILACALPKKTKFEWIIEKCVELGVNEIIPMMTERTIVELKKEKAEQKLERFRTIALSALKQSKQNFLPLIKSPESFSKVFQNLQERATILIPSLVGNTRPLFDVLQTMNREDSLAIMVGPEGDFTIEEYQLAHDAGAIPVSLGSAVLKVETAAIAAVACTHFYFHK